MSSPKSLGKQEANPLAPGAEPARLPQYHSDLGTHREAAEDASMSHNLSSSGITSFVSGPEGGLVDSKILAAVQALNDQMSRRMHQRVANQAALSKPERPAGPEVGEDIGDYLLRILRPPEDKVQAALEASDKRADALRNFITMNPYC